MKRIEAFIRAEKVEEVVESLQKMNIPATIYESKGIGTGEKYKLRSGKTGVATMTYSDRRTIETIVDDNKVDQVISAIKESAKVNKTGGAG